VELDQPPRDRDVQTRFVGSLHRRVRRKFRVEERAVETRLDRVALVLHAERHVVADASQPQGDAPSCRGALDGAGEQARQHLVQTLGIGHDGARVLRDD
jgi:hypothetical protein